MSFAKCFLFSLIAFIGLNAVFLLLAFLISNTFDQFVTAFETDFIGTLMLMLFGPMAEGGTPGIIMTSIGVAVSLGATIDTFIIIQWIGFFVAPVIGAFLSGFFAEDRKEAFLGWFLTAIISMVIVLVFGIVELLTGPVTPPPEVIVGSIIVFLGVGLTIALFYGCIALLVRRD
ncbi:MAG: hypothetical protein ACFE9Q_14365 [Candidatus Hodarchaeota archaeon]